MVYHVHDSASFESKLAEAAGKLIIVDFFATWCGPCKTIAPQLEQLEQELSDVVFLKVDVDQCEDLAHKYNINAMPTFVFIKGGKQIDCFTGANVPKLKEYLTKLK